MDSSLAKIGKRDVAPFEPERAKIEIAKADALMVLARELRDWPLLETAIVHKIEQQSEFVGWWKENVTPRVSNRKANADRGSLSKDDAQVRSGIKQQQVSKWYDRLKDVPKYQALLFQTEYRKAMAERGQSDQRGASGTGENEWYTPTEHIESAREVLGAIDLDPASSDTAQEKVRAARYFTKADDGLKQPWDGRVWLNPPYAQPHIADFVSKMVAERRSGGVTAAIMLTHNYTDTTWFHEAAGVADAICFTRGRVRFYNETEIAAPTQGQAFFYFGSDVAAFANRFASVGFIVTPFTGEA